MVGGLSLSTSSPTVGGDGRVRADPLSCLVFREFSRISGPESFP